MKTGGQFMKLWVSEKSVMRVLGFGSQAAFRLARKELGLLPRVRSGSRHYYARGEVETAIENLFGSQAQTTLEQLSEICGDKRRLAKELGISA